MALAKARAHTPRLLLGHAGRRPLPATEFRGNGPWLSPGRQGSLPLNDQAFLMTDDY
ncbi:hypothetical protein NK6_6274 [Bradyrhizobium diazoefficiens]|uniref:Uncharacterized protein n=1 Tax=Bradyrhizobium diazoefficiens TaxID=1355477 RepID=A0A0E4BS59_9BRAD|nr:hypothetical protein NK6_6274 [Bradyrhizobium diazoefficiens]